ncbi:MAG: Lrp/AsnC family transcriptional regulator [Candidatus Freyarchaeota archaeon]
MVNLKLDDKDRKIITLLSEDPDVSQEKIAKTINLSQPSVAVRLKKLREMGAFSKTCGINPLKIGLHLAKVEISTNNSAKILRMFKDCPYFFNGFTVSGKNNLCLLLISEDIATLESIVDRHLRPLEEVKEVEFNIIISAVNDLIMPFQMKIKRTDRQPCGIDIECVDCSSYRENRCLGCPAIGQYKGKLW